MEEGAINICLKSKRNCVKHADISYETMTTCQPCQRVTFQDKVTAQVQQWYYGPGLGYVSHGPAWELCLWGRRAVLGRSRKRLATERIRDKGWVDERV